MDTLAGFLYGISSSSEGGCHTLTTALAYRQLPHEQHYKDYQEPLTTNIWLAFVTSSSVANDSDASYIGQLYYIP